MYHTSTTVWFEMWNIDKHIVWHKRVSPQNTNAIYCKPEKATAIHCTMQLKPRHLRNPVPDSYWKDCIFLLNQPPRPPPPPPPPHTPPPPTHTPHPPPHTPTPPPPNELHNVTLWGARIQPTWRHCRQTHTHSFTKTAVIFQQLNAHHIGNGIIKNGIGKS